MPELIPITLFLSVAAVMILRPLTSRLGRLLEAIAHEKRRAPADEVDTANVRMLVDHLSKRLDLIEERLDFTERLIAGSRRTGLAHHADPAPLERSRL